MPPLTGRDMVLTISTADRPEGADTMITLKLVRTNESPIAGVQDTWTVSVPTLSEAHKHLALYCDSERDVTAYATGADGEWLGSGLAGSGAVHSDWA